MTIAQTLRDTTARLQKVGISEAATESEFLVAELLGRTRADLLRRSAEPVPDAMQARLEEGIQQREQRKPLAYITGSQPFLDITMDVTPDVLIPRPETEQLAEKILKTLDQTTLSWDVVDVGTGSGNLAIALARHTKVQHVYGLDHSEKALAVARRNAERIGVGGKCSWILSDLLIAVTPAGCKPGPSGFAKTLDPGLRLAGMTVIVANLPYIRTCDLQTLDAELQWEPRSALDGGESGLVVIEKLIQEAEEKIAPGSQLWLEIGYDQSKEVIARLERNGRWTEISVENDLAGWPRFVRATSLPAGRQGET